MKDEVTLAQLSAEMAQLRQEVELVKQRLDMIYGALTRLIEAQPGVSSPNTAHFTKPPVSSGKLDFEKFDFGGAVQEHGKPGKPAAASSSAAGPSMSAMMMMDPASMLDSLRQHAENSGLSISLEAVDRLKSKLPTEGHNDQE